MKLPTYEEALKITENSEAFYVQSGTVQGYEYALFNYRLAFENDFIENDAWELRGLTFLKNEDVWERTPMLTKFLNLNQGETVQYGVVKDKEIDSVSFKEDGSLISFVRLPNGKFVPKTKMSFDNDQTKMVSTILFTSFIQDVLDANLDKVFLFELVSPRNKIVLTYERTELRLLQVRDKETGEYYSTDDVKKFAKEMSIPAAETFDLTLDEIIERKASEENIEGYVVKFKDGQFIKVKTDWYIERHGLLDDLSKENTLIDLILNEEIDDVLAELEQGSEERVRIEGIIEKIEKYYNHRVQKAVELRNKFFDFNDRKSFAIEHSKTQDFGIVMKCLYDYPSSPEKMEKMIKERIIKETSKLEQARKLLGEIE